MRRERPGSAMTGAAVSAGPKVTKGDGAGPAIGVGERALTTTPGPSKVRALLTAGTGAVVGLCLLVTLFHGLLIFLHVAPPNTVSQRYSRQIDAWIFPLFEQNWRLFAPNPQSANHRISARTLHTTPDGDEQVSGWFDLSAVDESAVESNPFPSHTTQNMLRRAWDSYLDAYGGGEQPRTERALMMQTYLRNVASHRITDHRGGDFEFIQLRVVTMPITAFGSPDPPGTAASGPGAGNTRYLPWWKVARNAEN